MVSRSVANESRISTELTENWIVDAWYCVICKVRKVMGSRNEPDETELWLLNDATLEEIEEIANGEA